MITINVAGDKIVGTVKNEHYSVPYNKEKYNALLKFYERLQETEDGQEALKIADEFQEAVHEDQEQQLEESIGNLVLDRKTNQFYLRADDTIIDVPLPPTLASKIYYAVENEYDVTPIEKFWTRLLRNPNIHNSKDAINFAERVAKYIDETFVSPGLYNTYMEKGYSHDVAREFATVPQTPITMEGLLVVKKVVGLIDWKYYLDEDGNLKRGNLFEKQVDEITGEVTEVYPDTAEEFKFQPWVMGQGGDPFYLGDSEKPGHIIQVGKHTRLPGWSYVNCDPRIACVPGLHAGNQDYLNGWENSVNFTLNNFLDPADIGAIPYDDVRGTMRVLGMMPYSIKNRETDNSQMYHSSEYAAKKDEEWEAWREELKEKYQEEADEVQKEVTEKNSLLDNL